MKIILIPFFIFGFLAKAEDVPNYKKEEQLYQIYKKYNESPTPQDIWNNLVSQGSTQTYTIQKGDTLWDLSEALFADANYWPKIWSINNQNMTNPHEILPEQVVHFTEGSFGEPPQISVNEAVDNEQVLAAPVAKNDITSAGQSGSGESMGVDDLENIPEKDIPPPTVLVKEIEKIPSSFPGWDPSPGKVTRYKVELKPFEKSVAGSDQNLDYYISDELPIDVGQVTETDLVLGAAASDQIIYVKFEKPPAEKVYHVIADKGDVNDKFGSKSSGKLVQVQGEIEVLDKVNDAIYRAKVSKSIDQVYVGGKLIPGPAPTIFVNDSKIGFSNFKAQIIGGQFEPERSLFANGSFVFINLGSADGVSAGQKLPIFKNQQFRNPLSQAVTSHSAIGEMVIVHTSQNFATALITKAIDGIRVGDPTAAR